MASIKEGEPEWFKLTQVIWFKQCIKWDYVALLRWICVNVCLLERIWHSQQPDVCRAIPLHNYLRTSGTYKHSERAPALVFFSPVLSLHHCPRSQVCSFLPLCVALSCLILYKQSCFQFPLPLFPPPSSPHLTPYAYIHFSIPCLNTCIFLSPSVFYHPCICTYIYNSAVFLSPSW